MKYTKKKKTTYFLKGTWESKTTKHTKAWEQGPYC